MWISKKKWDALEKRVAVLERDKIAANLSAFVRRLREKEKNQIAVDCATQHIREFLAQSANREIADAGKACGKNCPAWKAGKCKSFDWLNNLEPITSQSSVKMSVHNAGSSNRE